MSTEEMPPLPTIIHGRVIDGIAAMTVIEHMQQMHEYAHIYAAQEVARVIVALDVDRRTLFGAIRSLGHTTTSQTGEICDVVIKAIRVRGAA
jgi:hypothetical protein